MFKKLKKFLAKLFFIKQEQQLEDQTQIDGRMEQLLEEIREEYPDYVPSYERVEFSDITQNVSPGIPLRIRVQIPVRISPEIIEKLKELERLKNIRENITLNLNS